ncbi:MAG: MerR family transcriptional regulator [Gammaproteobacteria bacterium]|nr:MerR family transcriptional regulator [Gammaproteobacteria bacterium]
MASQQLTENQGAGYRIGAVCKLTGLSAHVLRVWEKRYGIVQPKRLPNRRRVYSDTDVEKLSLLKTLVDRGQAIGTLASLDMAELARRVRQSAAIVEQRGPVERLRLAVVGEALRIQAGSWQSSDSFELIGAYRTVADLIAQSRPSGLDVVVLEWPTIHPDSSIEANRLATQLNVRQLILLYHYGSQSALSRLNTTRVATIAAPLDKTSLEAFIVRGFGPRGRNTRPAGDTTPGPGRRYSEHEIAHVAQQAAAVGCECPRHLADLITRLTRFETYSAECESRNEKDAAVHHYLYAMTSQARSLVENALAKVVEMEGLSTEPVKQGSLETPTNERTRR